MKAIKQYFSSAAARFLQNRLSLFLIKLGKKETPLLRIQCTSRPIKVQTTSLQTAIMTIINVKPDITTKDCFDVNSN